ncbi:hypothetical protein [Mucilaginibacter sp. PAMB04168]|uniref:hypothetical protein n=1 Tax=Mucilaginibacter sp. PAMB04168 TaxID=3138567 RepID=UPI0031F678F8
MKISLLSFCLITGICIRVSGQPQVVTTGNNLINISNPYGADIVIGSDANLGVRHDASIMWWSAASASRISNTNDIFNFQFGPR